MGSNLIVGSLDGDLTRQQVIERFRELSEQAAYEDGHEYSGNWNMLTGVDFVREPPFLNARAALDYITAKAEKWECALAVRYRHRELVKKPTFGGLDYTGNDRPVWRLEYGFGRVLPADQLGERDKAAVMRAVERQREAQRAHDVAREVLRRTAYAIERLDAVEAADVGPQQRQARKAKAALDAANVRLAALIDRLAPKLYAEADAGERWMIGGWAAS